MEPTQVVISNLPPVWVQWLGNIGLLLFGLAMVAIAVKLMGLFGQLSQTLNEVNKIVQEDVHRDMMPDVKAITRNVKVISDDAAGATHSVTDAVTRVSHIVSSVTAKLESPAVKAVGAISGILAGARALSGGGNDKDVVVVQPKKRGGILGFIKK